MLRSRIRLALATALLLVACGGDKPPKPDIALAPAPVAAADAETPAPPTPADVATPEPAPDATAPSPPDAAVDEPAPDAGEVSDAAAAPAEPDASTAEAGTEDAGPANARTDASLAATASDTVTPPPPEVTPPVNWGTGTPCSRGSQCSSGVCEGQGCGTNAGRCAPKGRLCTRDLQAYCGCDGKTFRTSGSCPGRLFKHRGPCRASDAPTPSSGPACAADKDCTVYFRTQTCNFTNPVAIHKRLRSKARKLFPDPMGREPVACAPPDPQDEFEARKRFQARCVKARCELVDTRRRR